MSEYIIISPVKNEEQFIEETIQSVLHQTHLPVKWIIVNDGSTDKTSEIINQYAFDNTFIIPLHRQTSGEKRIRGQGVIEAFNAGLGLIENDSYEFLVKLDGDLKLPEDYFEKILARFRSEPKLGIAGGVSYTLKKGKWVREKAAEGYTFGESKIYRKQCFDEIGGLVPHLGWDGIDHIRAVMLGWKACSFNDIIFYHLRPEGTATGIIKAAGEEGICCHYMGYHPFFFILRALRRMLSYPLFLGGLTMIYRYLYCLVTREKSIEDSRFISFLRKNQLTRIYSRNGQYTF